MVVDTIHVMDANETPSEAIKNYAGAAFLLGMAVFAVGLGAGMVSQSIKNLRKDSSTTLSDDLMNEIRQRSRKGTASGKAMEATEEVVDGLKRTVEDILSGHPTVIDQVKSETDIFYVVVKTYKGPTEVGTMIPDKYLVKKSNAMPMADFMKKPQVKFKSRTSTVMEGGITLVTVEEILNSEPVKPV